MIHPEGEGRSNFKITFAYVDAACLAWPDDSHCVGAVSAVEFLQATATSTIAPSILISTADFRLKPGDYDALKVGSSSTGFSSRDSRRKFSCGLLNQPENHARVLNYLNATGFEPGLLADFGHHPKSGWERTVRSTKPWGVASIRPISFIFIR